MPVPSRIVSDDPVGGRGRAVLAIDYGRSRMGLALSDSLGITARPLEVCFRVNRRRDMARLGEICRLHNVGTILVGWPVHLDGSVSEMARETERFAGRLRKELRLPVELVDERLTSWEAQQTVRHAPGGSRASKRNREAVDDVAAAVILRDYLSRTRRGSQE